METVGLHGQIRIYTIPEWSDEEFRYWWSPETDQFGQIIRPARISDETKQSWQAHEPVDNLVTNTGLNLWLVNTSVLGQGNMFPFFQILSVGNGTITGVARTDTGVSGDAFTTGARKAPTAYAITGFTTIVQTNYASGDAVGTWTNIGVYGYSTAGSQNATTTINTGALMTHALYAFVKGASAYAVDYILSLSN